jgi:hypothetical protein
MRITVDHLPPIDPQLSAEISRLERLLSRLEEVPPRVQSMLDALEDYTVLRHLQRQQLQMIETMERVDLESINDLIESLDANDRA